MTYKMLGKQKGWEYGEDGKRMYDQVSPRVWRN